MNFQDIPQFTNVGGYQVDVPLAYFSENILRYVATYQLKLNPDFQRGHVWTEKQQIDFVEYILRGGVSGRVLYLNHPGWMTNYRGEFVMVDGLQRTTALMRFMNNEIRVFDLLHCEFEGKLGSTNCMKLNINNLKTRREVLNWYLEMNSGGTVHTETELQKVRRLLIKELDASK